jgi:hypothetical protein
VVQRAVALESLHGSDAAKAVRVAINERRFMTVLLTQ